MDAKIDQMPVLVVGAGPSGLMLAHELKRLGISVTIVDKEASKSTFSRAIAVQIRTLEIFHALKLLNPLKEQSQAVDSISVFAESAQPISISIDAAISFYDRLLVVDQPHTEKVLEDALNNQGQEILRGVELIDFTEDTQGIRANLRMPHGEIKTERFAYLIGADGAHSSVRKKMVNQFLGSSYDDAFILADAECVHPFDPHTFRIFFSRRHFLALIPMHGKNHYRLISVRRGETKKIGAHPTIEEFQALAKHVVPFPLAIKNPVWTSRFFVQCRSASHYQEGRVFLVGDAAHIHSPAGGQGMNTGLQDAFNLAWKLALVIRDLAKPEVLLSYHQERKPVGDYLIDRTDRFFKFMVKSSLWMRLLRRFLLPCVAKSAMLRSRLLTIGSQTAIRYEKGVVCTLINHDDKRGIRVGKRVPNIKLITNQLKKTDLHSESVAGNFSCWLFWPKDMDKKLLKSMLATTKALTTPLTKYLTTHLVFAHDYDADIAVADADYFVSIKPAKAFISAEPFYVLLRPDHHVFCVGPLNTLVHGIRGLSEFFF